jgi:hypothetical protein
MASRRAFAGSFTPMISQAFTTRVGSILSLRKKLLTESTSLSTSSLLTSPARKVFRSAHPLLQKNRGRPGVDHQIGLRRLRGKDLGELTVQDQLPLGKGRPGEYAVPVEAEVAHGWAVEEVHPVEFLQSSVPLD